MSSPNILGIGDLTLVKREKKQSSGGILDIQLKDPQDNSMYEVEIMLGETDESHIIRTIEYWDLEKRRYPQRQHFAVLVAEKITRRFYENTIKQFCRENRISTSEKRSTIAKSRRGTRYRRYYTHYFSYEELVKKVVYHAGLYDLIDFAHRKRVDISDIQVEIDRDKIQKEFIENNKENIDDNKIQDIIKDILDFKPLLDDYDNEFEKF